MKNLVWVFGMIGAGKTTFIESHYASGDKILVGRECRRIFGAGKMAVSSNPGAPEETEVFVRQLVVNKIAESTHSFVYIDGMPRKPAQVRWILENYNKPGYSNIFLYVTCPEDIRKQRVMKRDASNPEALALANARFEDEKQKTMEVLDYLFQRIATGKLRHVFFNTKNTTKSLFGSEAVIPKEIPSLIDIPVDTPEVEAIVPDPTSIETMMRLNDEFSDRTLSKIGISMEGLYNEACKKDEMPPTSNSMQWAVRFVERAIEELHELLGEIPKAWWSDDQADVRKARVELIDCWHFLLSASRALGMDARQFSRAYYQKRAVNLNRQANGYLKREKVKGDDDHVGKAILHDA